jgi:hypothetical protein
MRRPASKDAGSNGSRGSDTLTPSTRLRYGERSGVALGLGELALPVVYPPPSPKPGWSCWVDRPPTRPETRS